MVEIIFLLALFICISSIFFPKLRKIALCIIATAAVIIMGFAALIYI